MALIERVVLAIALAVQGQRPELADAIEFHVRRGLNLLIDPAIYGIELTEPCGRGIEALDRSLSARTLALEQLAELDEAVGRIGGPEHAHKRRIRFCIRSLSPRGVSFGCNADAD